MSNPAVTLSLFLTLVPSAHAQEATSPRTPGDATAEAILARCAAAMQSSRAWQCQLRFGGVGERAGRAPEIRASALWVRAGDPSRAPVAIDARAQLPAGMGKHKPVSQVYRSDGTQIVVDNAVWKLRMEAPVSPEVFATLQLDRLLPPDLRANAPFAGWDRSKLRVDDPATIGSTLCHRVRFGDGTGRLWVAADTGRARALESSLSPSGCERVVFDELTPVESPVASRFVAPPRPGWRVRGFGEVFGKPQPDNAPERGAAIASFSLRRRDGTAWSLEAARGRVLVIDFFATWCAPCKLAMPTLQSLKDEHPSVDLEVVGISTWETGDPASLYSELGLDYGLLLHGDDVAKSLGVGGLPTVMVLDRRGRLHATFRGYGPDTDKKLRKAVTDLLDAK